MRGLLVLLAFIFLASGCAGESPSEETHSNTSSLISRDFAANVYAQSGPDGLSLDLSKATQLGTTFEGAITVDSITCSANVILAFNGVNYEVTINGKSYIGASPSAGGGCPRGTNPGVCARMDSNSQASMNNSLNQECSRISENYILTPVSKGIITACPTKNPQVGCATLVALL